jgi:hypothetical protein
MRYPVLEFFPLLAAGVVFSALASICNGTKREGTGEREGERERKRGDELNVFFSKA